MSLRAGCALPKSGRSNLVAVLYKRDKIASLAEATHCPLAMT